MANENVVKKSRFTIQLNDADSATLSRIESKSALSGLNVDRNMLIRYIIRSYEQLLSSDPVTKNDLNGLRDSILAGFALSGSGSKGRAAQEPKLSYLEKKEQAEKEKRQNGIGICEILGGRVEGDICVYKKYEITVGGFAVDSTVSDRLDVINEKAIDEQYYPSKEAYLKAKEQERDEI